MADTGTIKDRAESAAGTAQQQAGQVAATAKDQAAQLAGTATEEIGHVAKQATEQAKSLLSDAQTDLRAQASTQKDRAVGSLRDLARDLGLMAEGSEAEGQAQQLVSEAARRAAQAADYLDAREPGHLVDDLRQLGRRRSGAFLVGAAVLGFASGRLVKGAKADVGAPAPQRESRSSDDPIDLTSGPADPPAVGDTIGSAHSLDEPDFNGEPLSATGEFGNLARTPHLLNPSDV